MRWPCRCRSWLLSSLNTNESRTGAAKETLEPGRHTRDDPERRDTRTKRQQRDSRCGGTEGDWIEAERERQREEQQMRDRGLIHLAATAYECDRDILKKCAMHFMPMQETNQLGSNRFGVGIDQLRGDSNCQLSQGPPRIIGDGRSPVKQMLLQLRDRRRHKETDRDRHMLP